MDFTFQDCSFVNLGDYVIPDSVTSLYQTFKGCSSLTVAPKIPDGAECVVETFDGCSSLDDTAKEINQLSDDFDER